MIAPRPEERSWVRVNNKWMNLAHVNYISAWPDDVTGDQRATVYFANGDNDKVTLRSSDAVELVRLLNSPGFRGRFVALDNVPNPNGDGSGAPIGGRGFPTEALR